jgi:vancomycin permeability regulator SanA
MIKKNKIFRIGLLLLSFLLTYTALSSFIIQSYESDIVSDSELDTKQNIYLGIVFGGGVREDAPLPLVRDRLNAAHRLLENGAITKILVSGDNRSLDYNEPTVMKNYLIDTHGVNPEVIQEDFAGRSTYETCERASRIFGVRAAYLISEKVHLPRAIYLCRHFGIDAYGYASDDLAASGLQLGQKWREILARDKAVFNVNIKGEQTILGDPIDL